MCWINKIEYIKSLLNKLTITDNRNEVLENDLGFDAIKKLLEEIRKYNKTVYAIGNGASASMASHFAADLAKNGKLHTQVFSDLSLITAISNDLGYENIFAEPLRRRGIDNDLLVAISSSGNSENVINAVREGINLKMKIITISSMNENNKLRKLGDFNLYIPAITYGDAESCHAVLLHYCIDLLIENFNGR